MRGKIHGFTLIELLVVIAIIAILAAILFPIFQSSRKKAEAVACMSNMKQLGAAFKQYHSEWNGVYVPGAGLCGNSFTWCLKTYCPEPNSYICPSAPNGPGQPQVSSTESNKFWNMNGMPTHYPNDAGWEWCNPADGSFSRSHYGHNMYIAGWPLPNGTTASTSWFTTLPTEQMILNPSRTIYLCEANWIDLAPLGDGGYEEFKRRITGTGTRHNKGINVVCCDGHAKFVQLRFLLNPITPADSPVYWEYNR